MKKFVIFIIVVVSLIFGFVFMNKSNDVAHASVSTNIKKNSKEIINKKSINKESEKVKIKVDIKGSIASPGVYEVDSNSRVIDIINIAGGVLDDADTDSINLSKKVQDEAVIIIYSHEEMVNNKKSYDEKIEYCQKDNNDACVDEVVTFDNNSDTKESESGVININNASVEDLMKLSGIGDSKAKNIIEYRDSIGGFKDINDIKNVKGIGDSIFDKIKDHITI